MPFCSQCGNAVHDADVFCGRCGKQQPPPMAGRSFGAGAAPPPGQGFVPPAAGFAPPPSGYRPGPATADPLSNVPPRTWAILCYIPAIGWIASIVVLASDRFKRDRPLRFHAFQALYLFVAWLIADWVLRPLSLLALPMMHFGIYRLVELVLLGLSIFMMVKAANNETFSLPIFGELAERSLSED